MAFYTVQQRGIIAYGQSIADWGHTGAEGYGEARGGCLGGGRHRQHVDKPASARVRREEPTPSGEGMTCEAGYGTVLAQAFLTLLNEPHVPRDTAHGFQPTMGLGGTVLRL